MKPFDSALPSVQAVIELPCVIPAVITFLPDVNDESLAPDPRPFTFSQLGACVVDFLCSVTPSHVFMSVWNTMCVRVGTSIRTRRSRGARQAPAHTTHTWCPASANRRSPRA